MSGLIVAILRIFALAKRRLVDAITGQRKTFVRGRDGDKPVLAQRIQVRQTIMKTESLVAKLNNIRLAVRHIDGLVINDGEILSFWHLLGRPTGKRGYLPSRSLVGGNLRQEYGGGLCQLAGIIYYLSLKAGLQILERFPHTRDIYREHERFAPLGSDASVAFGLKDLRVRNTLGVPVQFRFDVRDNEMTGFLCASSQVRERHVEFRRVADIGTTRTVETFADSGESDALRHIATSRYIIQAHT